jgi:hypothetical protein
MNAILELIVSGLRVDGYTRLVRGNDTLTVSSFDLGGLFSITPCGGGFFRLEVPIFRLNQLRLFLAHDIPLLACCYTLFVFPRFEIGPEYFEEATVAVFLARLQALYRTRGDKVSVGDIFPGCTISDKLRGKVIQLDADYAPCQETEEGEISGKGTPHTMLGRVPIGGDEFVLKNTEGKILLCKTGAKCMDLHFVLGKYHFAVQCKSGTTAVNVSELYNKAKEFLTPVGGLTHVFVLVASATTKISYPTPWPDDLIVVNDFEKFSPLLCPRLMRAVAPGE